MRGLGLGNGTSENGWSERDQNTQKKLNCGRRRKIVATNNFRSRQIPAVRQSSNS